MNFASSRLVTRTSTAVIPPLERLGENAGVTTFKAAAFENAQRLVSPTIRSSKSLPESAYETKNA